ncbi:hypothetical protein Sme01_50150 [Sphaerisporangium melleum]|uniref:Uncharacterized protein n=1 Tax=Sphaerisporangium melleum TaxID=321316 RepID=A0A917R4W9_9ACTN|nr:hypothetical protein [Sphaerisporangium melleum]GGK89778.1 hypothetical protein GCM10007964_35560 [Sphaerisporangium melleum]GII72539.1 hypothetical protein Sme01_50150 [Sphaerisporangium melleum]
MPRQIVANQPPSVGELEARVHTLEVQVAHLMEAVRSLTAQAAEAAPAHTAD